MQRRRLGSRLVAVSAASNAHRSPEYGDAWKRGSRAPEGDTVSAAVARALGMSRRAARVLLWGPLSLAHRCARVIAALKAAGDDEAVVRFIQPIDLAIHAVAPHVVEDDEAPAVSTARAGLQSSGRTLPGPGVAKTMSGMSAGAAVCARCGATGKHTRCQAGRRGDEDRVLWFCARCLDPHHHAPGMSGA